MSPGGQLQGALTAPGDQPLLIAGAVPVAVLGDHCPPAVIPGQQAGQGLARGAAPQPHGTAPIAAGEQLSPGAPGQGGDSAVVADEDANRLLGAKTPHQDSAIAPGAGDQGTGDRQGIDILVVALQHLPTLAVDRGGNE